MAPDPDGSGTARSVDNTLPDTRHDAWGPAAAAVFALLGFLPIALWIDGGPRYADYTGQLVEWVSGSAIAIGAGVILTILARRLTWLWPAQPVARLGAALTARPATTVAVITGVAFVAYALIARAVFGGRPILIDEIALLYHAQILAAGHLWLPAPAHPEFFSSMQIVDALGRVYSEYPVGGPAWLAPWARVGAAWLAGPVAGVASIVAFASYLRVAECDARVALGAVALFAAAPFVAFMSGTHMSCVPAVTCALVSSAALVHVMASPSPRPALAWLGGLALGAAATIRPVEGFAFALPAAIWYLWRAIDDRRRWLDALASAAGVAIPIGILLWVNTWTTGAPLRFGYEVFWGSGHDLGFHRTPIGTMHTPARGLQFISTYTLELQRYLFETPIPSLLPAIGALALTRRMAAADRYLLMVAAALAGLYSMYWFNGFYLGPRLFFALTPLIALWTARAAPRLYARTTPTPAGTRVRRTAVYALAISAVVALVVSIPERAVQYASQFGTERWIRPGVGPRAGVHDAIVFVRESWDSQLVARMWALGVRPGDAEQLYQAIDACRLDDAIRALEVDRDRGEPETNATDRLRALVGDSARLTTVRLSVGASARETPGANYPARCTQRIAESAAGVLPLAPFLLLHDDATIYARDLHARDSLLTNAYPGRPIYLARPASDAPTALPVLVPVSRDSLTRDWAGAR
jgi:hypothetical protein